MNTLLQNKKFHFVMVGVLMMSMLNVFAGDKFETLRKDMVSTIDELMRTTESFTGLDKISQTVRDAMLNVPRHKFVPASHQHLAYKSTALPIEHQQTISQPYIVALMTELANVDKESVVLEVGTGSGYQAAVLSEIVEHVYTIEIVEPLGLEAQSTLKTLDYSNVTVRIGDGYYGWPEQAPFDAILVTAAAEYVPAALLEQLKPDGRLVIPVGKTSMSQELKLFINKENGQIEERKILPVAFVPLTGDH